MDFYTGQILPLALSFAPRQTAACNGQLLPVNQNQALFTLLGKTYGGDGQPGGQFGLPNCQGRTIVGFGANGSVMPLGATGGEASHVLTVGEMPQHVHSLNATNQGTLDVVPEGNVPGTPTSGTTVYGPASTLVPLAGAGLTQQGSNQPHGNMQPSLPIGFAIVIYGIYPSRS